MFTSVPLAETRYKATFKLGFGDLGGRFKAYINYHLLPLGWRSGQAGMILMESEELFGPCSCVVA